MNYSGWQVVGENWDARPIQCSLYLIPYFSYSTLAQSPWAQIMYQVVQAGTVQCSAGQAE